jgi:hypothetical protein
MQSFMLGLPETALLPLARLMDWGLPGGAFSGIGWSATGGYQRVGPGVQLLDVAVQV